MKIAVYTIAQNEEKFAERFMQSAKQADLVLIGLSPSEDRTAEIIQDNGGKILPIYIHPWRFDRPRNATMAALPADIDLCFAVDLDEVLVGDWRGSIEKQFIPGEHTRLKFRYVHTVRPDGSYGTIGFKDFAHCRSGYEWRHAVHENVFWVGDGEEKIVNANDLICEHRQDLTKKHTYLSLMEMECQSPGVSHRHIFWLAREYVYVSQWDKVLTTADRYLETKDTWTIERAWANMFKARAYTYAKTPNRMKALAYYMEACRIAPEQREPWIEVAQFHAAAESWPQAYGAVCQALAITVRPDHYLTREDAWNHVPHDMAGLFSFKLDAKDRFRKHVGDALQLAPHDAELRKKAQRFGIKLPGS